MSADEPTAGADDAAEEQELLRSMNVTPGAMLAGKYRVDRVLAAGGMGVVLKAQHVALDQPVALKLIRPELTARRDVTQRFMREARAAARVSSDHVARVVDVGELEDGTPLMVMEFLEGEDLHEHTKKRGGRLEITDAIDVVVQALLGLKAAHDKGIVHRDLKPSNLFLERQSGSPRVKLLDFGISKIVEGHESTGDGLTTGLSQMMGTPRFMSPEQVASSKNVDHRTDQWAMGVILYEQLTGAMPFEGSSVGTIFSNILTTPLAPLRELRPEVPIELEDVVSQMLQKERSLRFDSTGAVLRALAPFASPRWRLQIDALAPDTAEETPPPNAPSTGGDAPPTRVVDRREIAKAAAADANPGLRATQAVAHRAPRAEPLAAASTPPSITGQPTTPIAMADVPLRATSHRTILWMAIGISLVFIVAGLTWALRAPPLTTATQQDAKGTAPAVGPTVEPAPTASETAAPTATEAAPSATDVAVTVEPSVAPDPPKPTSNPQPVRPTATTPTATATVAPTQTPTAGGGLIRVRD